VRLIICSVYVNPATLKKLRRKMPKGKVIKENEGLLYGYSNEEWASFNRGKRYRIRHPERNKKSTANWKAKQTKESLRERGRKVQLKLMYGLTPEDYDMMLKAQSGCCKICGTDKPTGKWKVFAVDHCHITNKVRGLLCNECNRGMGLLRDSSELLRKAADYLDSYTT
jgi:hypothetical protein